MEANLGSQKLIFEVQLGLHFGEGGLGGSWAPCWTPYRDPLRSATIGFLFKHNLFLREIQSWPILGGSSRAPNKEPQKVVCGAQEEPPIPPQNRGQFGLR